MSDELVFYTWPQSRGAIAHWMLEEVGEPYRVELLNLQKGEQKRPEFLAINPMGKVPALTHGGVVVTEYCAILAYLADAFPAKGLAPAIGDKRRATFFRWLFFVPGVIEPASMDKVMNRPPVPPMQAGWGDYDTMLATLMKAVAAADPWLLGSQFTAADVAIGSSLRWGLQFKMFPESPEPRRYVERCEARPALKRASRMGEELMAKAG